MFSTLNMKNFIIAGHEHSTRDSRGQRLISINPVIIGSHLKNAQNLATAPVCKQAAAMFFFKFWAEFAIQNKDLQDLKYFRDVKSFVNRKANSQSKL